MKTLLSAVVRFLPASVPSITLLHPPLAILHPALCPATKLLDPVVVNPALMPVKQEPSP